MLDCCTGRAEVRPDLPRWRSLFNLDEQALILACLTKNTRLLRFDTLIFIRHTGNRMTNKAAEIARLYGDRCFSLAFGPLKKDMANLHYMDNFQ